MSFVRGFWILIYLIDLDDSVVYPEDLTIPHTVAATAGISKSIK